MLFCRLFGREFVFVISQTALFRKYLRNHLRIVRRRRRDCGLQQWWLIHVTLRMNPRHVFNRSSSMAPLVKTGEKSSKTEIIKGLEKWFLIFIGFCFFFMDALGLNGSVVIWFVFVTFSYIVGYYCITFSWQCCFGTRSLLSSFETKSVECGIHYLLS